MPTTPTGLGTMTDERLMYLMERPMLPKSILYGRKILPISFREKSPAPRAHPISALMASILGFPVS